jgi:hypothetical protein
MSVGYFNGGGDVTAGPGGDIDKLDVRQITHLNYSSEFLFDNDIPVILQAADALAACTHPSHIVIYAPGDSRPCRLSTTLLAALPLLCASVVSAQSFMSVGYFNGGGDVTAGRWQRALTPVT